MFSDVLRCSQMFSDEHRCFWIFSRYSIDVLLMFSRCSQDVCRIFPGCFQDALMGLVGLVEFDDHFKYGLLWSKGTRWSQAIRWSIGRMDFDNPKVYGDTFISDGLVNLSFRFVAAYSTALLELFLWIIKSSDTDTRNVQSVQSHRPRHRQCPKFLTIFLSDWFDTSIVCGCVGQ